MQSQSSVLIEKVFGVRKASSGLPTDIYQEQVGLGTRLERPWIIQCQYLTNALGHISAAATSDRINQQRTYLGKQTITLTIDRGTDQSCVCTYTTKIHCMLTGQDHSLHRPSFSGTSLPTDNERERTPIGRSFSWRTLEIATLTSIWGEAVYSATIYCANKS